MSKNDELFQEEQLEEQLDALARAGNQSPTSFKSQTYYRLKQFHAVWVEEDAQAIERVRQRLGERASSYVQQPQSEKRLRHLPPSWSMTGVLPHPMYISRTRAFISALVAVLIVGVLVSSFVLLLYARPAVNPSITASDPSKWHLVASPNVPKVGNTLNGVSAATGSDAWAVGTSETMTRTFQGNNIIQATTVVPLTEHWDGQQWKIVSNPHLPGQVSIFAVVDIAPGDAWLVGSVANASTVEQTTAERTLIEHWDGQQWRVVASPSPGKAGNRLQSIAALSPNDIWAVGAYTNDSTTTTFHALIEHWDGQQWNVVSAQIAGPHEFFTGIAAISPNDIWAVGVYTSDRTIYRALIEHWDGSQWHVIPSPSPGFSDTMLDEITAVSANDVWAIGTYDIVDHNASKPSNGSGSGTRTLVEHWDGRQWRVVPSPNPSPAGSDLVSITSLGTNNIWITGVVNKILHNGRPAQPDITFNELIEHWDGQQWHIVDHPPNPGGFQALSGITRDPAVPGKLWIVGSYGSSLAVNDSRTLIETNM